MSTVAGHDGPRIRSIEVDDDLISARLVDGRVISVEGMLNGVAAPVPAKGRRS
jgi:hypothetical protein